MFQVYFKDFPASEIHEELQSAYESMSEWVQEYGDGTSEIWEDGSRILVGRYIHYSRDGGGADGLPHRPRGANAAWCRRTGRL